MVGFGIDVVHTDDVGPESLHESSVPSTLLGIDERVARYELVCYTCAVVSTNAPTDIETERNGIPFMKNCFPSLVKNLLPVAVIVGRALAVTAPAMAENQDSLMLIDGLGLEQ